MAELLLLWYPKCSTCRKAKSWLDAQGLDYRLRDITEDNPSREELALWLARSGLDSKKIFNTSGQLYRALGLKEKLPLFSEEERLALLATDGMLVKRPILVSEKHVLPGFRQEQWQAIIKEEQEA